MHQHNRSRIIALVALLGCCWGIIEIQLGTLLHALSIPFCGALLTGMAVILLCIGRYFIGIRGSVLTIGLTSAFLKMLFVGSIAFNPVIAILLESIIVELVLLSSAPSRIHYMTAGAVTVGSMFFFPFLSQGILGGMKIIEVYYQYLVKSVQLIGFEKQNAIFILLGVLILHVCFGLFVGIISSLVISMVEKRLKMQNSYFTRQRYELKTDD